MGFLGLSRPSRVGGTLWLYVCGVAVVVGAVGGYLMLAEPLAGVAAARAWRAVPVTLETVGVERYRTGGKRRSTRYRVVARYAYAVGGETFTGGRLRFGGPPRSRDRRAAERSADLLRRTPPPVCYVDPADPANGVLDRSLHAGLLAGLPFPAMLLAGVGGGLVVLVRMRRPRDGAVYWTPHLARWTALPVSAGVAAFASTLVLAAGYDELAGLDNRNALFALVPAAAGVLLLANLAYALLGLLNPRPQLWLTNRRLVEGQPTDFDFAIVGGVRRLRRLVVRLEGRRHTITREGRSYSIDDETFHEQTLVDLPPGDGGSFAGRGRIVAPHGKRPRYGPVHGEDTWWLVFDGEVVAGPDVRDELELTLAAGTPKIGRPKTGLAAVFASYGGPRRGRPPA